MDLTTYQSAGAFLKKTQGILEEREAENNLMLGLCLKLSQSAEEIKPAPYFATVKQNDDLLIAAVMTPPHNLIIYCPAGCQEEMFALLTRDLTANGWPVPGVIGSSPIAEGFAKAWEGITGMSVAQGTRHRIYNGCSLVLR